MAVFEGVGIYGWIALVERFFRMGGYNDAEKLVLASGSLQGEALSWYNLEINKRQFESWVQFKSGLMLKFGSKIRGPSISLFRIKQTGTIEEYIQRFEDLSSQVSGLDEQKLEGIFLNGLTREMQELVHMQKPRNLPEMMAVARDMESCIKRKVVKEELMLASKENKEIYGSDSAVTMLNESSQEAGSHKTGSILDSVQKIEDYSSQVNGLDDQELEGTLLNGLTQGIMKGNGDNMVKKIELPIFHGLYPCSWITQVERLIRFDRHTDIEKIQLVTQKLKGDALSWFKNVSFKNWKDFKSKLYVRFGNLAPVTLQPLSALKHEPSLATKSLAETDLHQEQEPHEENAADWASDGVLQSQKVENSVLEVHRDASLNQYQSQPELVSDALHSEPGKVSSVLENKEKMDKQFIHKIIKMVGVNGNVERLQEERNIMKTCSPLIHASGSVKLRIDTSAIHQEVIFVFNNQEALVQEVIMQNEKSDYEELIPTIEFSQAKKNNVYRKNALILKEKSNDIQEHNVDMESSLRILGKVAAKRQQQICSKSWKFKYKDTLETSKHNPTSAQFWEEDTAKLWISTYGTLQSHSHHVQRRFSFKLCTLYYFSVWHCWRIKTLSQLGIGKQKDAVTFWWWLLKNIRELQVLIATEWMQICDNAYKGDTYALSYVTLTSDNFYGDENSIVDDVTRKVECHFKNKQRKMGRYQHSLKVLLRQWEVTMDFQWWLAWLFCWKNKAENSQSNSWILEMEQASYKVTGNRVQKRGSTQFLCSVIQHRIWHRWNSKQLHTVLTSGRDLIGNAITQDTWSAATVYKRGYYSVWHRWRKKKLQKISFQL
ncbi:PREDICTED: uncharacterized protein LOC109133111 [Camelina sativa]|uniref:Uncharacterized protein LOC109133111 n=1 Tax=Camelina sativa TaxID=90675 RepID=A0ABM1RRC2_CAMSA|nr:PREDICTED: uncharacterized protein LOC109133111 [Camelina sativa]